MDFPISYTLFDCIEEWCSVWYLELRTLTITSSTGNLVVGVFKSSQHDG